MSRSRTWLVLVVVIGASTGWWTARAAHESSPVPIDRSQPLQTVRPRSAPAIANVQGAAPEAAQNTSGVSSQSPTGGCQGLSPGPAWTCVGGAWQAVSPPLPSGAGRDAPVGGCGTGQPAPSMVCRNGAWVLPSVESAGDAVGNPPARPAAADPVRPAVPAEASSPTAPNPLQQSDVDLPDARAPAEGERVSRAAGPADEGDMSDPGR